MSSTPSVSISQIGAVTVYNDYVHRLEHVPEHSHPEPFLLSEYVAKHTKDGVASDSYVYAKDAQFQLQLRAGPSVHRVFHQQAGEEWIYVLQGEALIKLIDGKTIREHKLTKGSCFLVPGNTPKSLQICAGCTLLVMNRQRKTKESYPHYNKQHVVPQLTHLNGNRQEELDPLDKLFWLCHACGDVAHWKEFQYQEYFSQIESMSTEFDKVVASGKQHCAQCKKEFNKDLVSIVSNTDASLQTIESVQKLLSDYPHATLPATTFNVIDSTIFPPPYHLFSWIDANRHSLAPPVGNKMIHSRGTQWKVMIVGGPNQRTDYHIDDGEEWFLMIEGDMTLKIVDKQGTKFRDVHIRQGESFLLPANVPHSPQRLAHTIGLVIERERFSYELDGLRWYCSNVNCREVLKTFSFRCEDLGTQLKILIEHWYEDSPEGKDRRTCKKCGTEEKKPATLSQVKEFTH